MATFMADAGGGSGWGEMDVYFIGETVEGTKAMVANATGGWKAAQCGQRASLPWELQWRTASALCASRGRERQREWAREAGSECRRPRMRPGEGEGMADRPGFDPRRGVLPARRRPRGGCVLSAAAALTGGTHLSVTQKNGKRKMCFLLHCILQF